MEADCTQNPAELQFSYSGLDCERVLGLIEADFAAAGQNDVGVNSPLFLANVRAGNILLFQRGDYFLEIVTHQVENTSEKMAAAVELPLLLDFLDRMNTEFGRRQAKNQPPAAAVNGAQFEHIAKESAIGLRMITVEEQVGADDHEGKFTSIGWTT